MKKAVKWLLGAGIVVAGVTAYQKQKDQEKHDMCQRALTHARERVAGEHIVGTWINMTKEESNIFGCYVVTGGVTTQQQTYDFVADAQTGDILSFEQQIRI